MVLLERGLVFLAEMGWWLCWYLRWHRDGLSVALRAILALVAGAVGPHRVFCWQPSCWYRLAWACCQVSLASTVASAPISTTFQEPLPVSWLY